jgi:hypothetical protein
MSDKARLTVFVDGEEKARLLRDAKRSGVTLTEYINRALKIGLPVVRKTLRKAKKDEEHITEKTVAGLDQ